MKQIHIIGGGTVSHVRNHLALCAPAYGTTARKLEDLLVESDDALDYGIELHLTKMADRHSQLETNEDISNLVDKLVADPDTKIIFFNPALVDFQGSITTSGPVGYEWSDNITTPSGKYEERLQTSKGEQSMLLWPTPKLLGKIRKDRKDIFLVAFKTTCGATQDDQFLTGLHLLKTNSCNLVLANDTKTRVNMIITPEQARYVVTQDRDVALDALVEMAISRAQGTFTRTTVVPGKPVAWTSDLVPLPLKKAVDHCIRAGAYKPFNGATVGHFAYKTGPNTFVTSRRKVNFNQLSEVGMVFCESKGPDEVIAHGSKPSVGGQSQRIIFREHPGTDCIVHFHCPPKPGAKLSVRSQFENECGSHQCGQNTSEGLREEVNGIKCVYLDNHGPNIVFSKDADPQDVINFIDKNFDLSKSTDQVNRSEAS
jgi:hypothetical protein